ncbi:MAG: NAD-dependent epimerase/dehydratase family protein, partial [Verrucomicrobiaceae bacterium]
SLARQGIRFLRLDLSGAEAVQAACAGQEYVFHCAARSSPWGRRTDFLRDNVQATANVAAACGKHGVRRLVHVSTPSIYFEERDRFDLTEASVPARHPINDYARTKRMAEDIVNAAGCETVILRPRAVFGPGDTSLFPRLLRAAGQGGFPLIGPRDPLVEVTWVGNVVDALTAAAVSPPAAGRSFNITNGEPWPREKLLSHLFRAAGLPWRPRRIPLRKARWAAMALEAGSRLLTGGRWEPPLTRYSAGVLAFSQTFDLTAARSVLDYKPRVSVEEGLQRFGEWWRAQSGGAVSAVL